MKKIKLIQFALVMLYIVICGLGCKNSQDSRLVDALDLFVRDEYNSSFVIFNKIVEADPKNARVLFFRAVAHKKNGDTVKSLLDFERVFELDNNFNMKEQDFFNIAEYNYTERRDFKKAIELFRLYTQRYPKTDNAVRAYVEIADTYSLQKDFDNALASYKKVIDTYKKGLSPIEKRAVALSEEAVNFLNGNSDFDRKPLALYSDMNNENDPVKKIEMCKKILEKYPTCNLADDIQFKIAKLYSVEGLNDFDKAQAEYITLINKYPTSKYVDYAKSSVMGIDQKYDRKTGRLKGKLHQ